VLTIGGDRDGVGAKRTSGLSTLGCTDTPDDDSGLVPKGTMAWNVGAVHEQSDFIGFNIMDATSQRPIVTFSYSSRDEAINAHGLVARRSKMLNTSAWSHSG
jgi:hypothetical protein